MAYSTRFDITLGKTEDPASCMLYLKLESEVIQLLVTNSEAQPLLFRCLDLQSEMTEQSDAIGEWLVENRQWLKQWKGVVVVFESLQATLIPGSLYFGNNAKALLDLQYGDLFRGTILTEKVPGREDLLVYRVPTERFQELATIHPVLHHRHLLTLWISQLDKLPHGDDGQAHLLFEQKKVFVAVRKRDWLLVQQYPYEVAEDVSYYLLAALQQFQLSAETIEVWLYGWIEKSSSLYLELLKYFRNIQTATVPEGIRLDPEKLEGQPVHYFTPLIQMAQCEL